MESALTKDIIFAIIFLLYPGFMIFCARQLEKAGMTKDFTRKFVHTGTGLVILFIPFFTYKSIALIPPIIFVIINAIDYKFGLLSQIQGEDTGNIGTVLYPIAYIILISVFFHTPFWGLAVLGILTMAIGDAAASLIGRTLGKVKYEINGEQRSYAGSIAMLVMTFIITLVIVNAYGAQLGFIRPDDVLTPISYIRIIAFCLLVGAFATAIEALSIKGSDNVTVPVLTALFAWILITQFMPNVLGSQEIVNQPLF